MRPKLYGLLLIALGVLLLGITYKMVTGEGRFFVMAVICGPLCLAAGLGFLMLPVHLMVKPKEIDGSLDYGINSETKFTPLGWGMGIAGTLVGALLYAYLKFGM